jgi:phosphatidylglycerophosphatase A
LGNLAILLIFLILAVLLSSKAEEAFGRKDDGRIVIDEVAGFLVTMAGVRPGLAAVILGFLLFRAFDILKPWPVRFVDKKCPGGLGVVLDDVVAGLYSLIVLYVILYLWPSLGTTSW